MNYQTIKRNYEKGLWSAGMVKLAVRKGILTREEYTEITGRPYN